MWMVASSCAYCLTADDRRPQACAPTHGIHRLHLCASEGQPAICRFILLQMTVKSSGVSAVPVATTPAEVQAQYSALEELRNFCSWQNALSCAFALCAGAVAHNPARVWRWLEHKRVEVESWDAAWEIIGVLVAVALGGNAILVYAGMARRRFNASTAPECGGSAINSTSHTFSSKKQKRQRKPKLEFIRK